MANTIVSRLVALVGMSAGAMAVYRLVILPRIRRWGATGAELEAALPGDELVPRIRSQSTMAISIAAPPEAVWPWLVQMGVDRAGFYSYTWVENGFLRLGVTNAGRIVPEWQTIKVGDRFWFTPEDYPTPHVGPTVTAIEPYRALVLNLGEPDKPCPGTWQFVLDEWPAGSTRLILRSRTSTESPLLVRLSDLVLEPGSLIMSRRMLVGIKQRAESLTRDGDEVPASKNEAAIDSASADHRPRGNQSVGSVESVHDASGRAGVTA
ncbi:MAG: hypothetical protein AB7R89_13325 [Dehalococcoidia bacterium]